MAIFHHMVPTSSFGTRAQLNPTRGGWFQSLPIRNHSCSQPSTNLQLLIANLLSRICLESVGQSCNARALLRERYLLARKQRAGSFGIHWLTQSETLRKLTAEFSKFCRIGVGFNAFGDHLHPEVVCEHDRR